MQLARRLHREIRGNPVKAAGLGVLLLVAGYFWAPLVAQLVAPGGSPTTTDTPGPSDMAAAPTVSSSPVAQSRVTDDAIAYDWRQYARLMDEDARMSRSVELSGGHDPFKEEEPPTTSASAQRKEEEAAPVVPSVSPAEAGLVLGSTLVSDRTRVAEINGKSYAINDQVRVIKTDFDVGFRIVAIEPRRVVLERNGERFELKIPRPLLDSADQSADNATTGGPEPSQQRTGALENAEP